MKELGYINEGILFIKEKWFGPNFMEDFLYEYIMNSLRDDEIFLMLKNIK